MTPAIKISIGLFGISGVTGVGVGGFYLSSKEDIFSKVKDEVLGTNDEFNPSWKSQFNKLSSENGNIPADLKKLKSITAENEQISAIKGWCSSNYGVTYKSFFSGKQDHLLEVVKKYCIQSLQEKLADVIKGDSKATMISTSGEEGKSDFVENYKKLKDHNITNDGKLDSILGSFDAAKAEGEAETKWSKLRDWCKAALTKAFKGGSSDLFKTSNKFCIKRTQ